jgi:hypothetical protein
MMGRLCRHVVILLILSGMAGGVLYLSSATFRGRWKAFVVEQLEQRGIYVDFGGLSLSLSGNLVARDLRVYNDAGREELLAALDRVKVAFDFGELIKGNPRVEGLELEEANVALPVDPERPELTVIELANFNARVFFRERRLQVVHATGRAAGVWVDLTVDLLLAASPQSDTEKKAARVEAMRRLELMRDYRSQIQLGLDWLGRFDFDSAPQLTVDLRGATNSMEELEVGVMLEAREFEYEGYKCRELMVDAGLANGEVEVNRLRLVDGLGHLEGRGTWRRGAEEVNFRVTSNADLRSAAEVLVGTSALREVVFYDQGPSLALEGKWFFGKTGAAMKRPVDVRGEIHCPRFASRGEVFEGLSASFGVSAAGIYVREGLLRHKTGSLALQVLAHEEQGLKYRAILRMDPVVFKPFVKLEQTRALIDRFQFERDASIYFKLEGQGPTLAFADCRNKGHGEMRGMSHLGVPFVKVDADVEFQGPELIFRNVRGEREDGGGEVEEAFVQLKERWVRLRGVRSKCDPVPILKSFVPKIADIVARYRLPSETVVNVDGVFGWGGVVASDARVAFSSPEGSGIYRLGDIDYLIKQPQGELLFVRDELRFDVNGQLFGDSFSAKGVTDLSAERDEMDMTVRADAFEYDLLGERMRFTGANAKVSGRGREITYDVTAKRGGAPVTVKGRMATVNPTDNYDAVVTVDPFRWEVFGEMLDFNEAKATLKSREGTVDFDANAKLMTGAFDAKGSVTTGGGRISYQGHMGVNALSFKQFSKVYTPSYETEGDLTGHFDFSGVFGDWRTLKGDGVAIIVNGNLYAVPILGPLTPLLGGFLPSPIKGFNVAKEATCTYRVEDGFLYTDNLEALTAAFRLVAKGNANFIEDKVAFDAQARIRGLPGIVLRPVSELLEYQARGTIGDPAWKSRLLNFGGGAANTEAVKPTGEPKVEEPEKKRLRLPNLFRPGAK